MKTTENIKVRFSEPFWNKEKSACLILCTAIGLCDTATGIESDFVDNKPKRIFVGLVGTGHLAKSSQLRKR